jgi:hypothetical protein
MQIIDKNNFKLNKKVLLKYIEIRVMYNLVVNQLIVHKVNHVFIVVKNSHMRVIVLLMVLHVIYVRRKIILLVVVQIIMELVVEVKKQATNRQQVRNRHHKVAYQMLILNQNFLL